MRKILLAVAPNGAAIILLLLAYRTVSSPFEQVALSLMGLIYLAVLDNGVLAAIRSQSAASRLYSIAAKLANDTEIENDIQAELKRFELEVDYTNRIHFVNAISIMILGIVCLIGIFDAVF